MESFDQLTFAYFTGELILRNQRNRLRFQYHTILSHTLQEQYLFWNFMNHYDESHERYQGYFNYQT